MMTLVTKLKQLPRARLRLLAVAIGVLLAAAAYFISEGWPGGASRSAGITLYGNVDIREANLAFNVPGRVTEMLLEEGDRLTRGQPLASLDSTIYEAGVAAAAAKLGIENATLKRLLAGSRPEEIKKARGDAEALQAQILVARLDLARTKKLLKNSFASQQKYDSQLAHLRELEARHDAAKQILSLAIQGPRNEDIEIARARVAAARADFDLAQRRLAYTKLKANTTGTVMTRIVEPGDVVMANSPIYSVALDRPLWVRTYLPEPQLGRVHPGQKATVGSDSWPNLTFDGRVGFISPIAEFTPKSVETGQVRTSLVYRMRVYINAPDNRLRQGMPVTVRLQAAGTGKNNSTTDGRSSQDAGETAAQQASRNGTNNSGAK